MGTTRMSHTAKDGVVDASSKVFGTKNFYIAGCSVFPTGGHVPPTLTIVAMAIKLADEIKRIA
jgi:choline dehydrogenase-like flavoprotein